MDKLVTRPLHDFVPELLKMLSSPISMMVQPSYDRQGRLTGYRQAFGREGMGEKDIQIVDSRVQRVVQQRKHYQEVQESLEVRHKSWRSSPMRKSKHKHANKQKPKYKLENWK